ncbi:MAG: hypothetical protein C4288_18250 [Leptolyngbya sp. ERB_1_1]
MFTVQRQEQTHNFAASEWTLLMQAPMQAVAAVALADKTDPLSLLRTAQATIQILSEEQVRQKPWNHLIGCLMDSMNAADEKLGVKGKELLMRKQFIILGQLHTLNNTANGHDIAIETCKQIALILSVKVSPLEMEEFRNWLLMITIRILKTAKKSSVFEITNLRINERERLALQRLNALFNTND